MASQHFEGHKDDILCMASHDDSNLLVTGSYDGVYLLFWKLMLLCTLVNASQEFFLFLTILLGVRVGDIILWATDAGHMRSRLVLPGILAIKGDQRPIEGVGLIECGFRIVIPPGGRQVSALL